MVVNTAMVRSSEHTTPQHTTCAFCTELRPVCVHYGCQGAVNRRVIAAPCPRASSRGGAAVGTGRWRRIAPRTEPRVSTRTLYKGIEPV